MRSRELDTTPDTDQPVEQLLERLKVPQADRYEVLFAAARAGASIAELESATNIDPWYLRELTELARTPELGQAGTRTYRSVDTCAAEFPARTPYFYSGWEHGSPQSEVERGTNASVMILGSGPNRIGQGIEFDYCCVHAAWTVKASGRDAVMVNCNPETVSTDYDTSTRLYFEPLTLEDVLAIVEEERPEGVIVQFGGQTPLKLAAGLQEAGVPVLGTSVDAIDLAEDRGRFGELLDRLGLVAPPYATAASGQDALAVAKTVGFPLLARPSYVLGGRAMEIVYSQEDSRTTSTAPVASAPGRSTWTASSSRRSRSTSTRYATARRSGSAASCSTSSRPASTPATPRACSRRTRCRPRSSPRSAVRPS